MTESGFTLLIKTPFITLNHVYKLVDMHGNPYMVCLKYKQTKFTINKYITSYRIIITKSSAEIILAKNKQGLTPI